jgi:hypothetical protein
MFFGDVGARGGVHEENQPAFRQSVTGDTFFAEKSVRFSAVSPEQP